MALFVNYLQLYTHNYAQKTNATWFALCVALFVYCMVLPVYC